MKWALFCATGLLLAYGLITMLTAKEAEADHCDATYATYSVKWQNCMDNVR